MISSLLAIAFGAETPDATGSIEIGNRSSAGAFHVGFDWVGASPGVGARLDLGHRVAVEAGGTFGLPDAMRWSGGASIGLSVAPIRVQLATRGSLDLRVGAGVSGRFGGGGTWMGGGLDLGRWASAALSLSPDGAWSVQTGIVAVDQGGAFGEPKIEVVPSAGVRFRLDPR